MSPRRIAPVLLALAAVMATAGCSSPPRMWEKQMARALAERPPEVPAETFEKLAFDSAAAAAHAQLCGIEAGRIERLLPDYLSAKKAPRPDIVLGAFRFHRDRMIAENLHTAFPPGECWQRKQDYEAFVADMRDGREPFYRGIDLWR